MMQLIAKFLYYSSATIMLDVPDDVKKLVASIANNIPVSILEMSEGGIEDSPHITVLYGVSDDVKLSDYISDSFKIRLDDKITYFHNEDFTVAKIAVFSDRLNDLHNKLKLNLQNQDKHPIYNPHVTIAYLKPGKTLRSIPKFKGLKWEQKSIGLYRNGLLDSIQLKGIV